MQSKLFSVILGLLVLVIVSSRATAFVYTDGTFNNSDWNVTLATSGQGGTATAGQMATGGNPGSYWDVAITLNATTPDLGTALVGVFSINSTAVYDPSVSGAIASIDYSEDSILLSTLNASIGGGQSAAPALLQNGILYTLTLSTGVFATPDTTWTSHQLMGLTAADFFSGTLNPDFSVTGAPIEFGFWRAISHPTGNPIQGRTGGIDNWTLTVNSASTVPEPATLSLLSFGLLGVGFAARRRRRI